MQQTYQNMKKLTVSENFSSNLISSLAAEYQETEDPVIFAKVFCDLYPYTLTQVNKYFNLTDEDKASFVLEELHKAMLVYDETKGAKIQTLFSTYLNRRLYAETMMLNHQKRKANYNTGDFEDVEIYQSSETDFTKIEFMETLKKVDSLTDTELKYCEIVMSEHQEVTDSEVARALDVSPSAIFQLKKRLKTKLNLNFA
jgi:DNA-binding CsgD family transcriptional regulator